MTIDQSLVAKITAEVIARVQESKSDTAGNSGIFATIEEAVKAARTAYNQLKKLSIAQREELIQAMRQVARDHAEELAEMAVTESGMGRVADKIIKHRLVADKTPGTEGLRTEAWTGDRGLTLLEMGPYGVIGSITPTTNPCATVLCNAIGMIAAGNAVVFSPHPTAKNTSLLTIKLLNEAIIKAGGPANLLTAVAEPSLKATNAMMSHPGINMLVATGGPGVVKAVMSSGKKAIGAGAGNPPAVVDETADIEKAARDIIAGCSFDNNLPCIAEKEVIVVGCVADKLMSYMQRYGAYLISGQDIDRLAKVILTEKEELAASGCTEKPKRSYAVNKKFVGKDAKYILSQIGINVPDSVKVVICEAAADHPFVLEELMMPVLPVVQVKDIDAAIELAVKVEHGNRHTAIMHSKNVDNLTRLAKAIETTIFVKNAPSFAGIGVGGEGFTTFTIAGPTGEGLTSARSFTRQRRCVLVDGFSIV
ncbi:aldehyde dehydrogenase family protein [Sporomusa acidovorans]|uniref:Succinate-semialdehyde dehydrogenase (Acetylating) n=1 Tax=Sporomusa acidovorans (strain ATCC 49682 / DSM 3132 / Mol) TaxID=1123286 RepID=A0ABZ3J017_SPOA4|nr:aldehyde dehydrogenase family protein [Sporomusa acidovorans]OZC14136.1 succinate-semialdehyde dehydrogenase (acetylating) [Sporomusa acidovorans DSM 3132]SDE69260.1 propionaldehyde dehydrogenase [Sporomusa acidovorans]